MFGVGRVDHAYVLLAEALVHLGQVFTDDLLLGLRDAAAVRLAGVLEGAVIDLAPWATAPAAGVRREPAPGRGAHARPLWPAAGWNACRRPGPRRQLLLQDGQLLRLAGAWGRPPQAHHPLSGLEVLKLIREHLKVRRLADLWMLEYLQVPKVARLLLEAETNPLEGVNRERSLGALKVEE
jgi:hypothetical protein